MALREIIAKFGFDFDQSKLKQVDAHVEKTKAHVEHATHAGHGLLGLFAGHFIFHALEGFIEGIAGTAVGLKHLSDQVGLSTENIQVFEFGANLAGIKTEEFEASVRKLSLALGRTGEGAKEQSQAFAELKVGTKNADGSARSLNEVLPEVVAGFGEISDPAKKAKLAVDLFGRSGVRLVGFLSKGKEGLAELTQEFEEYGGGFTEDAIGAAERFEEQQVRLNLAFTSFKSLLAEQIFPALSGLLHFFSGAVKNVKQIAKGTELAKGVMIAFGVAGAVAISHLLLPFAPVIAAVAALSLGFDDLLSFLNGEDSVIGEALNQFLGEGGAGRVRDQLNEIDKQVKEFFTGLIDHPKKFFSDLEKLADDYVNSSPLLKLISGGKGARGLLGGQTDDPFSMNSTADPLGGFTDTKALGNLFDVAKANLTEAGKGYQQQLAPNAQQQEPDWFARLSDKLFGGFAGGAPTLANVPGSMPSPAVAVPGVATNQIDQQNRINITVQAGTPDETTRAIEDGATRALGNERRAALAALEQGTK